MAVSWELQKLLFPTLSPNTIAISPDMFSTLQESASFLNYLFPFLSRLFPIPGLMFPLPRFVFVPETYLLFQLFLLLPEVVFLFAYALSFSLKDLRSLSFYQAIILKFRALHKIGGLAEQNCWLAGA